MKDQIIFLYLQGSCIREVADALAIGKTAVAKVVKESGVSRPRKIRESVIHSKVKIIPPLQKDQIDYMDGLVISDSHLKIPPKLAKTSAMCQFSINQEWLESIRDTFKSWSIYSTVNIGKRNQESKGWVLLTERNDQFYLQRIRWYPEGVKRIPKDIDVSNCELMRNWIFGDGTRVSTTLRLCTDDFVLEDIEFVVDLLKKHWGYNFKIMNIGKNSKGCEKYRIYLGMRDGLRELLQRVGNPEGLFSYKFREI